jgi:FlgD Ig-like domain
MKEGKCLVVLQRRLWVQSMFKVAPQVRTLRNRPLFFGLLPVLIFIEVSECALAGDSPSVPPAIVYQLDRAGQVSAAIYDTAGCQVRSLLTGESIPAGSHTLQWDGLDREGRPLPAGEYELCVLSTPGFTREFLVNVGTNPRWSMFDRQGALYIGSICSEGPPHLLKLSLDGRHKYWDTGTWGLNDGMIQVARIDDAIYLLDMEARLWIRRAYTGGHFWDHPERRKFPQQRITFADLLHSGDVRPSVWPNGPQVVFPMCMAAGKEDIPPSTWPNNTTGASTIGEMECRGRQGMDSWRSHGFQKAFSRHVCRYPRHTG